MWWENMSYDLDSDADSDISIDFDNEKRKGPVQKVTGPQHVLSPETHGLRRRGASPPGKLMRMFQTRSTGQSQKRAKRVLSRSEGVGRVRNFPSLPKTPLTSNAPGSEQGPLQQSDTDVILIDDENDDQGSTQPNGASEHLGKQHAVSRKLSCGQAESGSKVGSGDRSETSSAVQKKARRQYCLDSSSDDDDDVFEDEKPKPATRSRRSGSAEAVDFPSSPQKVCGPCPIKKGHVL